MEPTQLETKQSTSSYSEVALCEANDVCLQQREANEYPHSIWCNYVIMKEIIKNLVWSERKKVGCVCSLWCGIIHELDTNARDLHPHTFCITQSDTLPMRDQDLNLISSRLNYIEPEIVIIFSTHKQFQYSFLGSAIGLPHPFADRMSTGII